MCGLTKDPQEIRFLPEFKVVIEKPVIYRPRLMKGDPNDLIVLALLAGRYQERALNDKATVELVTPHEWKGSVSKEISNRRVLKKLKSEELAVLNAVKCAESARHNVIDAIGIALWKLGR
jgi:hypothetical protein